MKSKALIIGLLMVSIVTGQVTNGHAKGEDEMIPAGEAFVDFEIEAHDGTVVSRVDLEGRPFLLFFYPKADTPG